MMLCKLILRNIRRSFQDYAIYFLTLILGVAIFYVFNSIESQTAMMKLSASSREIIQLFMSMLSYVSAIVACILGFLVIYANRFLIKRRNREFAVYMTLGMGRRSVSGLLMGETLLIGILSLLLGLCLGVFSSQFMSILVARMFETDMTGYTFIYSPAAARKTILYFCIIFLIVLVFNVFSVSRCQLIDLMQLAKRGERHKTSHPALSLLVFAAAVVTLGYCYYQVSVNATQLSRNTTLQIILAGCVSTLLLFWSLSGFLLGLAKWNKSFYLKGLRAFTLRQVDGQFHTSVVSMSIICLLFFVTITVLSAGLAMNNSFRQDLQELCPRDLSLVKLMDLPEEGCSPELAEDSRLSIAETLEKYGFDLNKFSDYVEITTYTSPEITYKTSLESIPGVQQRFPYLLWDSAEIIVGVSDYNRLAAFYGQPTYTLEENEYLVLCTFQSMKELRDQALATLPQLTVGDTVLQAKEASCQTGFLTINITQANVGVILVPDSVISDAAAKGLSREENILAADYQAVTKEDKQTIEDQLLALTLPEELDLDGLTRLVLYESANGLSTIITFIALYLGLIFLIAGAAIVALKQLTDSADNRVQYRILDKLGVDKKMQHQALRAQMAIFFGMPMFVAILHSIFGIQYARNILSMYGQKDLITSILLTALALLAVYGSYFIATYQGSKRMIDT